jgi:rhamnosyltransferase
MQIFSVVLAAYNGEKWLQDQLSSILNQDDVRCIIHISIDKSTDNTSHLCDSLAQRYENISCLPSIGRIGDAAKNFFKLIHDVDFTSFDYIAFADQDDVWSTGKLSRSVDELKRTRADGYSSNVTAFWSNGENRLIDKAQPQVEWDYLFESAGPGCTFVLTQSLALALQVFIRNHPTEMQSVWLHDWFTYAFARANGYKWIIDPQSTMQYRQHTNNQVGVNLGFKAFKHRAAFILSGKWFEQSALIANLVGKSDSDFVKAWLPFNRLGFLKLAFQASKCRRKRSEQVWFFCICLVHAITGINTPKNKHGA